MKVRKFNRRPVRKLARRTNLKISQKRKFEMKKLKKKMPIPMVRHASIKEAWSILIAEKTLQSAQR